MHHRGAKLHLYSPLVLVPIWVCDDHMNSTVARRSWRLDVVSVTKRRPVLLEALLHLAQLVHGLEHRSAASYVLHRGERHVRLTPKLVEDGRHPLQALRNLQRAPLRGDDGPEAHGRLGQRVCMCSAPPPDDVESVLHGAALRDLRTHPPA